MINFGEHRAIIFRTNQSNSFDLVIVKWSSKYKTSQRKFYIEERKKNNKIKLFMNIPVQKAQNTETKLQLEQNEI